MCSWEHNPLKQQQPEAASMFHTSCVDDEAEKNRWEIYSRVLFWWRENSSCIVSSSKMYSLSGWWRRWRKPEIFEKYRENVFILSFRKKYQKLWFDDCRNSNKLLIFMKPGNHRYIVKLNCFLKHETERPEFKADFQK